MTFPKAKLHFYKKRIVSVSALLLISSQLSGCIAWYVFDATALMIQSHQRNTTKAAAPKTPVVAEIKTEAAPAEQKSAAPKVSPEG